MNALAHSSGMYYEIIDPGSGATPTLSSNVVITYTGTLLDGTVFDQRTTPNNTASDPPWPLSQLIEGWRVGLPLIHEGGHIKLIVPSSMAYGCTGYGMIPGNAILYFDINLIDVQ
jgi:FKBP-type peptidyl-prolyl cis-trans isomerase FkpA